MNRIVFAGNRRVNETVEKFALLSRFPNAIIIEGEEGMGKHTLSAKIADAAVCSGENPPCGVCRNCMLTQTHNHPDIISVEPEENKKSISVAQVREIISKAYIKPYMAQRKVFVIDKAHLLSETSQNTLLKVIEEPPSDMVFIFLCESAASLLPTVISRCVVLSLTPPETEECVEYISAVSKKNREEIENALRSTRNNIGKALKILESRKTKKSDNACEFYDAMMQNGEYEMLKICQRFEKDRVAAGEFLNELKMLVAQNTAMAVGDRYKMTKLYKKYEILEDMVEMFSSNVNLQLFFGSLVLKLLKQ